MYYEDGAELWLAQITSEYQQGHFHHHQHISCAGVDTSTGNVRLFFTYNMACNSLFIRLWITVFTETCIIFTVLTINRFVFFFIIIVYLAWLLSAVRKLCHVWRWSYNGSFTPSETFSLLFYFNTRNRNYLARRNALFSTAFQITIKFLCCRT